VSHLVESGDALKWTCATCAVRLETRKVEVAYRGSKYPVELPRCPICGTVFVSEQLALGKMAQVEQLLEDK
jgi:hypothetical protein